MIRNEVLSLNLRKHGWPNDLSRDGYLKKLKRVRPEGYLNQSYTHHSLPLPIKELYHVIRNSKKYVYLSKYKYACSESKDH